jgi:hypothetical protein
MLSNMQQHVPRGPGVFHPVTLRSLQHLFRPAVRQWLNQPGLGANVILNIRMYFSGEAMEALWNALVQDTDDGGSGHLLCTWMDSQLQEAGDTLSNLTDLLDAAAALCDGVTQADQVVRMQPKVSSTSKRYMDRFKRNKLQWAELHTSLYGQLSWPATLSLLSCFETQYLAVCHKVRWLALTGSLFEIIASIPIAVANEMSLASVQQRAQDQQIVLCPRLLDLAARATPVKGKAPVALPAPAAEQASMPQSSTAQARRP